MTPSQAQQAHKKYMSEQKIAAKAEVKEILDARLEINPDYVSFDSFCYRMNTDLNATELMPILESIAAEYERQGWHTQVYSSCIMSRYHVDDACIRLKSTPFDTRSWWQKLWSK